MKYMLLIHQGDSPTPLSPEAWATLSEDEQKAVFADYQAINKTPGVTPGLGLDRLEPVRVGPEQEGAAEVVEQPEREGLVGPHPRPRRQDRAERGRRHRVLPVAVGHGVLARLEQPAGVDGGHGPHRREPDHGHGEGDLGHPAGQAVVGGVGQPQDPGRQRRVGGQGRGQVLGRGVGLVGHPHRPHRHRRLGREPLQLLDEHVDERTPVRRLRFIQRDGLH